MMAAQCPKCGTDRNPGPECAKCGVIYAKAESKTSINIGHEQEGMETTKKNSPLKMAVISGFLVVLAGTSSFFGGVEYQKMQSVANNSEEKKPQKAIEKQDDKVLTGLKGKDSINKEQPSENDIAKQQKMAELQRESERLIREAAREERELKAELASMEAEAKRIEQKKLSQKIIEVTEVYTKALRRDSIGSVWVSFKVTAKNNGKPGDVFIRLQGVDREGFAVEDKLIRGHIPHGETRTLTDTAAIDEREYSKISKWKVEE
jgi:hypothetical protein